jgi:hypothetical protein
MLRKLDIAASWQRAKAEYAAATSERDQLRRELAWTKQKLAWTEQSLDDCTQAMRELRAATLARQRAECELAELRREHAIQRAREAERDPTAPLN